GCRELGTRTTVKACGEAEDRDRRGKAWVSGGHRSAKPVTAGEHEGSRLTHDDSPPCVLFPLCLLGKTTGEREHGNGTSGASVADAGAAVLRGSGDDLPGTARLPFAPPSRFPT